MIIVRIPTARSIARKESAKDCGRSVICSMDYLSTF